MRRVVYAFALILALLVSAQINRASAQTGLQVEDLFRIKRVSDPQVSPDGKNVAYVITTYDRDKNNRNNQIWLVGIDGGQRWIGNIASGIVRHHRVIDQGIECVLLA